MKHNIFLSLNFLILFGIGVYLVVYSFTADVELKTGIPVISGTLIGFSIYSTYEHSKSRIKNFKKLFFSSSSSINNAQILQTPL